MLQKKCFQLLKLKMAVSEKEFKSAILVICAKLLENKATRCEVVDESFKDYNFDVNIEIKRLFNMKTAQEIISKSKVVEK